MTETMIEVAEMYAYGIISEEVVVCLLKKYNEPYERFEDLPKEFHDYVDIRQTQLWIEEKEDAEILETLRNLDE